jgi:hypothetical protein
MAVPESPSPDTPCGCPATGFQATGVSGGISDVTNEHLDNKA